MPLSTDVRLPKMQEPVFPDRCVVCGRPKPDDRVEVGTRAIGWWTWVFGESGKRFAVQVPACAGCGRRLTSRRRRDMVLIFLFGFAGVGVGDYLFGTMPYLARSWLVWGIFLVGLVSYAVWYVVFPPPFGLTAFSDSVNYEFRDRDYAEEFAALNGARTDAGPEEQGSHEPPAE
jgi:hypothetical protein